MSTKLNFTNRINLDPELVKASIQPSTSPIGSFEMKIDANLTSALISGQFMVVFTLKALGETKRIELAGPSDMKIEVLHSLHGMRNPLEVKVSLEVIQRDSKNIPIIRASVMNVDPEIPGKQSARRSVLKTKKDPGLNVPWRLIYSEGYPILHISDKNGLYDQLMLSPQFDPMILSDVVRQIFNWLIFDFEMKEGFYVDAWKSVFEKLGCDRSYFDTLPQPNEEDGSMEDMTPALREGIRTLSFEISDKLTSDLDLLSRLSNTEIGEE